MEKKQPFYLAGRWASSGEELPVVNPYNGETVAVTYSASTGDLEEATVAAVRAFETMRKLPGDERARIIQVILKGVQEQREEFGRLIAQEAGKPVKAALAEVDRGLLTLEISAEEARRIGGEVIPLDVKPFSRGRLGLTKRFPLGPVAAVSPFNFPLNLALHKVAPAIAAGDSIVLKPPSKAPLTMLKMAEIIQPAGLPEGALSILPMNREVGDKLVGDERFKMLTFTGSSEVGWSLKEKAGRKKVILELGGNAGAIVDKGVNLEFAATRLASGGYSYAGQSCISVQRVYVHRDVSEQFRSIFLGEVGKLKVGDPLDPATDVGPMIDRHAVARTEAWVNEAVEAGAKILIGGHARGPIFEPTVLADVKLDSKVNRQEVFAPVVALFEFDDFRNAVRAVNDSIYGLQAGVFTPSLENAWYAFEELQVGGVTINEVPTFRIDNMPYGGTKYSGIGREGPRFTIEEMTELKLMVLNTL